MLCTNKLVSGVLMAEFVNDPFNIRNDVIWFIPLINIINSNHQEDFSRLGVGYFFQTVKNMVG